MPQDNIPSISHEKKSIFSANTVGSIIVSIFSALVISGGTWFITSKVEISVIHESLKFYDYRFNEMDLRIKNLNEKISELKKELSENKRIQQNNAYINNTTIQQLSNELLLLKHEVKTLKSKSN